MATRFLSTKGRIVAYLPNLRAAVKHFRAFSSSHDEHQYSNHYIEDPANSQTVWPDTNLGPFGPQDRRFPLPGRVGPTSEIQFPQFVTHAPVDPSSVLPSLPVERHYQVVEQFLTSVDTIENSPEGFIPESTTPTPSDMLECIAQDCPQIMRKDFSDLFPQRNILEGTFTIITISQRTQNDMTGWSSDVEVERETLLETFLQGASEICEALQGAGYWADFIDPSCGKPYLGPHTNTTLFETDERYRKLGFEINDLGCCKVIQHHLWGSHSYVGCLFTNAPLDHAILQGMQKTQK